MFTYILTKSTHLFTAYGNQVSLHLTKFQQYALRKISTIPSCWWLSNNLCSPCYKWHIFSLMSDLKCTKFVWSSFLLIQKIFKCTVMGGHCSTYLSKNLWYRLWKCPICCIRVIFHFDIVASDIFSGNFLVYVYTVIFYTIKHISQMHSYRLICVLNLINKSFCTITMQRGISPWKGIFLWDCAGSTRIFCLPGNVC